MADSNWQINLDALVDEYLDLEAEAHGHEVIKDEASADEKRCKVRMDDIKSQLRDMLVESGVTNDSASRADLIVSKGRQSLKQAPDADIDALPDNYIKTERKPDNVQIKAALARGEWLPGFELETGKPVLSIKVKEQANG